MSRMLKRRTSLFDLVGEWGSCRGPGVSFGELFFDRFGGVWLEECFKSREREAQGEKERKRDRKQVKKRGLGVPGGCFGTSFLSVLCR